MTILTKPFGDKTKSEKDVPLVAADGNYRIPDQSQHDVESESLTHIHIQRRSLPTMFLLLTALFVMGMGILGGVYIYRQYAHARHRVRFHGFCGVPYDSSSMDRKSMIMMNSKWSDDSEGNIYPSIDFINQFTNELSRLQAIQDEDGDLNRLENRFFNEEIELGESNDESYSKITVPDFRDGRRGRFLHDFKNNQSSIIDKDNNRCFVMPLDRDTVLPPESLLDLVTKMWNGYYDIDTSIIRKDYRVVTPAVLDDSVISTRIAKECVGMNIYMLEKYVTGVYKRAAYLTSDGKFAEYAGKSIVEFNLVNVNELNEYESKKNV